MAWSWSHSAEAYDNARQNVANQSREWLEVVFAEWSAVGSEDDVEYDDRFNEEAYNQALARSKELADDTLADFIYDKMSDQAICDNGGHNAWCCPYGCGCHTVSFDLQEDSDNG